MKDFFKFMIASMLGFLLVMAVIFFISFGLLMGLMSFAEQKEVAMVENTVIRIELDQPIPERSPKDNFLTGLTSGSFKPVLGLNDIIRNIHDAKNDENVRGIILNLNIIPSGISTLEEIRNALVDFRKSGKFIMCYGEYMTQGAYYLASVSDEIFIHGQGFVDFKGLNARVMFIKGMLDKLDINMQILRHGKFKSAVEPLIQEEMSPENREQYSVFVNSIWNSMLLDIAESRGMSIAELNKIADELKAYDAESARSLGLIDHTGHRDEYRQILADKLGVEDLDDINFMSLSQYNRGMKDFLLVSDRIAVIYASGAIGSGQGNNEEVGADKFAETISKVRYDDDVKAVVLRVNSPGGDALASDVIWRELYLLNDVKPVIVSMGDVAASGGYWISSASDVIMANPTSLTGSIGVFGVVPDFGKFMSNKLGITYDRVGTNENSDFPSIVRPMKEYEEKVMLTKIENVYDLFLQRVAQNRGMSIGEVDMIGEGRIWSGVDAKENGLIDRHGGLYDAIKLAAETAGLDDYDLIELPIMKDPFEQIFEEMSAAAHTRVLGAKMGAFYKDYQQIQSVMKWEGVQARLPVQLEIE